MNRQETFANLESITQRWLPGATNLGIMAALKTGDLAAATRATLEVAATASDSNVKQKAIAILSEGKLEPSEKEANYLALIARAPDARVRVAFQWYLRALIGHDRSLGRRFRSVLEVGLRDKDASVRVAALEAIGQAHSTLQIDFLRQLATSISDSEPRVRHQAALILHGLGESAAPVISNIAFFIANCSPSEWIAAIGVLVRLDPAAQVTGPLLARRMDRQRFAKLRDYLSSIHESAFLDGLEERTPGPDDSLPDLQDGPQPPDEFWWSGKSTKLERIPWRLLDLLWRVRTVQIEDAVVEVWGEDLEVNNAAVKAAITKARRAVLKLRTPYTVSQKQGYLRLVPKES